jgi:hypothetical protein
MVKLHWFFWQQWTPSCATKIRFYRLPLFLHVFATLGSWCLWAALEISGHLRCAAPPCCWWHQWCHVFVNKKSDDVPLRFPSQKSSCFMLSYFPKIILHFPSEMGCKPTILGQKVGADHEQQAHVARRGGRDDPACRCTADMVVVYSCGHIN